MSNATTNINEHPVSSGVCSPLSPTAALAVNWDAADAGVGAAPDPARQVDILNAALEDARRGRPVFPLDGKIPMTPRGFRDAVVEELEVQQLFAAYLHATGHGLATGAGEMVLDVDAAHGGFESLAQLEQQLGQLPITATVETGGGGRHYYFTFDASLDLRCSAGVLGPGLDIRANGGYIVGAGSMHPSGRPYTWSRTPAEAGIACCPPWIIERLMAQRQPYTAAADCAARCASDMLVAAGRRNDHLFRRAALLRHFNFSPAAIFETLKIENQQCCNPPLPEAEVQRIAESVARYPAGAVDRPDMLVPGCSTLPTPVNAATWMQEQLPAPDPILDGAFDAGTKAQVVGASKSRKSFFLLQMVLCLAAGSRCFLEWFIPRARRVLFLNLEITPAHFQLRLRRLLTALGLTSESLSDRLFIHNLRGQQLGADFFDQLVTLVREHHIELLVVDPIYKLIPGDENAQPEIKRLLRQIDCLCVETGCAVLYSHHTAKGVAGDRQAIDRASGSGVMARDFDAQIGIVEHAEPQLLVVEQIARSYPPKDAFCIEWDADRGLFVVRKTPAIVRTSRNRPANGRVGLPLTDDDAVAVVALQPKVAGQFHAALRGLGFTEAQARATKDRLLEEGRLRAYCPPIYPRRVIVGLPDQIAKLRADGCSAGTEASP